MDQRGGTPGSLIIGTTPQQSSHKRARAAEELRKHVVRGYSGDRTGRRETAECDLATLDNEIPSGIH